MSEKKRILIIIATLDSNGGAEKTAASLSTMTGLDIIYLNFYKSPHEYKIQNKRYLLHEKLDKNIFGKIISIFKRALAIQAIVKKERINICLSFMEESNIPLVLSKIFGNKSKLVISIRNSLRAKYGVFYICILNLLYLLADRIVLVANGIVNEFPVKKVIENKIVVINNYIDIKEAQDLSRENVDEKFFNSKSLRIINVGRLHKQKNHGLFIKIIKKLGNVDGIIVGEGPEKRKLKELCRKSGVDNRVFFLGHTDNVYKYLAKSDIFLLTSNYEGFSNVLLEAMACGLPVVAKNCNYSPEEILENGKFGFVYDKIKDALNTIRMLINDEELRKKYSGLSTKRVFNFSKQKILKEWELLINKL